MAEADDRIAGLESEIRELRGRLFGFGDDPASGEVRQLRQAIETLAKEIRDMRTSMVSTVRAGLYGDFAKWFLGIASVCLTAYLTLKLGGSGAPPRLPEPTPIPVPTP